jgi:hypothetical protein
MRVRTFNGWGQFNSLFSSVLLLLNTVYTRRELAAVLYELASRAAELKLDARLKNGDRVMLDEMGPRATPRDSFGVVFVRTEPTVSAR